MPRPLLVMTSSKVEAWVTWDWAKERMRSLRVGGRTREVNAVVLKVMGVMESVKKESQRLVLRAELRGEGLVVIVYMICERGNNFGVEWEV